MRISAYADTGQTSFSPDDMEIRWSLQQPVASVSNWEGQELSDSTLVIPAKILALEIPNQVIEVRCDDRALNEMGEMHTGASSAVRVAVNARSNAANGECTYISPPPESSQDLLLDIEALETTVKIQYTGWAAGSAEWSRIRLMYSIAVIPYDKALYHSPLANLDYFETGNRFIRDEGEVIVRP